MSRYLTITVAFVGAMLTCAPLQPATAATDSTSKKKSSTTAKKKSTAGAADKKKSSADDADAGSAPASKKGALDLPLPAKVPSTESKSAPTAGKSSSSTGSKDASSEKSEAAPEKKRTDKKDPDAEKSETASEKKPGETGGSDAKPADKPAADSTAKREHAPNATVEPDTIAEFAAQPPRVQQMIRDAIDLTRLNLTYTFGSADPDKGGMDCSGTIFYLLNAHGFKDVARDSSGQYLWARKAGAFFPVVSKSAESVELEDLKPGDLMFWTGTYETGRDIPISHVMLYLGREKVSGKRIMFGASDGRSYNGVQRWGVSVFDFKMPKGDAANGEKAKADFVGYARIPGLRSGTETVAAAATDEAGKAPAKPAVDADSAKPPAKSAASATRKKKGSSRKSQ